MASSSTSASITPFWMVSLGFCPKLTSERASSSDMALTVICLRLLGSVLDGSTGVTWALRMDITLAYTSWGSAISWATSSLMYRSSSSTSA
ncbi:hypothetical protein D3C76_1533230 [compost metagenome]